MDGAYIKYLQSSRQTLLAYREKFVEISAFVSYTVVETRQAWQFFWRTTYVYISVNCITTLKYPDTDLKNMFETHAMDDLSWYVIKLE